MHQESISGVGNIYKSESLYLAGLNPARKVGSLTVPELEKLYNAICKVLSASYSQEERLFGIILIYTIIMVSIRDSHQILKKC